MFVLCVIFCDLCVVSGSVCCDFHLLPLDFFFDSWNVHSLKYLTLTHCHSRLCLPDGLYWPWGACMRDTSLNPEISMTARGS